MPDREVFGCLELAFDAGRNGGSCAAWLNAANEVAVEAFLADRIGWLAIADVVGETLSEWDKGGLANLDAVYAADAEARRRAEAHVARVGGD